MTLEYVLNLKNIDNDIFSIQISKKDAAKYGKIVGMIKGNEQQLRTAWTWVKNNYPDYQIGIFLADTVGWLRDSNGTFYSVKEA